MTVDLAGHVELRPGRRPAVFSTRAELAPRLLNGVAVQEAPRRAAALFTLCAPAHALAAHEAITVAGAGDALAPATVSLFGSTVREHLLRLCHDWPRRHAPAAAIDLAALAAAAPLWAPGEHAGRGAALAGWLRRWLDLPAVWFTQGVDSDAVADWCRTDASPTALALRAMHARAITLTTPAIAPLALAALPEIGRRLGDEPGWALRPRLDAGVPDTGPWSRAADGAAAPRHAWDRIASRLVDLVRLAGEPERLAHGALSPAPGVGLAWAETARGLLVHRVRVERDAAGWRVADYRVLAPTEWNFHPDGALARTLQALAPDDAGGAELLADAFDPCVPVRCRPMNEETADA
ncbi:MAG: hypothetical protein QM702_00500 [Rubrivivax sp.]